MAPASTRPAPEIFRRESQIIIKPGYDAGGDDGEVDPKIFDIDSTMMITTMVMMIGVGESGLFAEGSHTNCPRCCRAIVSRPFCRSVQLYFKSLFYAFTILLSIASIAKAGHCNPGSCQSLAVHCKQGQQELSTEYVYLTQPP